MESLKEIQEFLTLETPQHLKSIATGYLLSLTGSKDGQELLFQSTETITALGKLTGDKDSTVSKESLLCLVNLSANDDGGEVLLKTLPNFVEICLINIKDPECRMADAWTMVLSNISRSTDLAKKVFSKLKSHIDELVNVFSRIDFNKQKCHLNYIGPILSNISQVAESRELFCKTDTGLLNRLIPFVKYEDSIVRRGGIIGLIRNICFDTSLHSYLLEEIDILPVILYSLAGPEEYSEEENDTFPIELQFLGPEKKREEDPDIRRMLLDALTQLCATRKARDFLRSNGTYEILRELHKWENTDEGDKLCLIACENVVDILIRTEDEIGEDNLKTVDIPSDLVDKFDNMNSNLVEE